MREFNRMFHDNSDTPIDDYTLEQLQDEADEIRARINRFRTSLGRFFVHKQELIDLMCVAAVAQEPLLLVGPPGTAKSDLVLKFKDALGLAEGDYFEYMLTRFTEPSEIIGPIDINQLRDGRYIRREQGKLPTARLAFLDEIFKSNSAILNILLTIINEKKFYQDGVPQPVPPAGAVRGDQRDSRAGRTGGLKDRFVLKAESRSGAGRALPGADRRRPAGRSLPQLEPEAVGRGARSLDDLLKANRYLTSPVRAAGGRHGAATSSDRKLFFPDDVFREFQRLVKTLVREDHIFISDRKLVKLYKLFRVRAWLFAGGTVSRDDLRLLAYLGETPEEMAHLRRKVPMLLGEA